MTWGDGARGTWIAEETGFAGENGKSWEETFSQEEVAEETGNEEAVPWEQAMGIVGETRRHETAVAAGARAVDEEAEAREEGKALASQKEPLARKSQSASLRLHAEAGKTFGTGCSRDGTHGAVSPF